MKNFQTYFFETNKLYEFKIKIANCNFDDTNTIDRIKDALDAYCVETISKPKRLPIQEHKDFSKLGPCECSVIDVAVKYPTITEQIRQLIITRAGISANQVCVYTKDQAEQLDMVQERIDAQDTVIGTDLDNNPESAADGQELVGEKRNISLIKELQTRKYEFAQDSNEAGKTTNEVPADNNSPVGSTQNAIPSPVKGK